MKRIAYALLATTMIAAPAIAASSNNQPSNSMNQQQARQQNGTSPSPNNAGAAPNQGQSGMQQNSPNAGQNDQQAANNIDPKSLPRSEIRQVQQALNKDGFHAGRADGRWGTETRKAVEQFQQSKQINSHGQLNQQTLADLGVNSQQGSQGRQNQNR